mmetsp:Transcript_21559/g.55158  ORF Transcript_21559/g.55158 Transcript_21559/m.55158 type:complete len:278 (-) Transcript_21559:851-1684(-)
MPTELVQFPAEPGDLLVLLLAIHLPVGVHLGQLHGHLILGGSLLLQLFLEPSQLIFRRCSSCGMVFQMPLDPDSRILRLADRLFLGVYLQLQLFHPGFVLVDLGFRALQALLNLGRPGLVTRQLHGQVLAVLVNLSKIGLQFAPFGGNLFMTVPQTPPLVIQLSCLTLLPRQPFLQLPQLPTRGLMLVLQLRQAVGGSVCSRLCSCADLCQLVMPPTHLPMDILEHLVGLGVHLQSLNLAVALPHLSSQLLQQLSLLRHLGCGQAATGVRLFLHTAF